MKKNRANTKERILEIIESERGIRRADLNIDLQHEQSKSGLDPKGKTEHFKQLRYDLIKQIDESSIIGRTWITNGCDYNNIDLDWIQKCVEIQLDYMNETEVFKQLRIFFKQFLTILEYESILKKLPSSKTPPENSINNDIIESMGDLINEKNKTMVLALSYHFKHEANLKAAFNRSPLGDIPARKEAALYHDVSQQSFQQLYGEFHTAKRRRLPSRKILNVVVELLKKDSDLEAYIKAEKVQREMELNQ
jgi:hypothetical protein